MFETSLEVRANLTGKLGAVAFLDFGNVWATTWRIHFNDLRYDIGPGLRYDTPIGPVRVDLGYQVNPIDGLLVNGKPESRRWRIHFSIEIEHAPHYVHGDAARLQQVFWNLIKNAVKFTPNGGCVGVKVRRQDGRAIVQVTDSGAGIEPQALDRIFNAFEQGNGAQIRQSGGLGLGLAITKGLVELHGGNITARSDGPGTGATFAVTLPLYTGSSDANAPAESPVRIDPQRILLVEDDADTARLISRILRQRGHTVLTADSVESGMAQAAANAFDVLVSDIGLPDGSGLDLMRKLSEKGPVRAIVLSGYGLEDDLRRSREAGFQVHLIKPVTIQQLDAALAEVSRAQR
jgi:CheY-like chemotaxis protein